ncbi:MAG: lysine--tRNA ligase [Bacteroidetes bacterium]|nr:lysine--tRNA ligase [Bacteroidota bacterium]
MSQHLSEQEIFRRDKLKEIEAMGIEAYPAELFEVNCNSAQILKEYNDEQKNFPNVSIAGRIMGIRVMGKASFAVLQDAHGKIQLYITRDNICPGEDKTLYDKLFRQLIDIGDFVGVKGYAFITKMGETSIHVSEFKLLAKALKPLPVVKEKDGEIYDAVSDPEFRYRQRYVDLVVNAGAKETFIKRAKMIQTIRDYLNEHGGLEVDTPVLQNIPGGAAARPFITHHNALDVPFYLRIANELYLKRLIVGGFDFVYEFSRNFRNEGMDRTHNPEFTVLEYYVAYKDYLWMMDFTEAMLQKVVQAVHGSLQIDLVNSKGETKHIDFNQPFPRIPIFDAIKEHTGFDIAGMDEAALLDVCKKLHIETDKSMGKGKLIDEIFGAKCEGNFVQPTFILDYPVELSPLTKKHRSKPGLVERFELMVNGKEIANAYSELNDPIEQRARFEEQTQLMARGDEEAMFIDHDFLRALEYGMPPTSGIGIGIDRLCMILTNQPSIQEVLFFPQMRPEKLAIETEKE